MFARRTIFALVLATVVGCGPPAPPPPTPAPTTAAPSAAAAPNTENAVAAKAEPSPAASPATNVQPGSPAADLRGLAARLVERSGDAWRISEEAATELEKLGPEVNDSLLPLLADKQVEVRRGAAFYLLRTFNPNDADQVHAFTRLLEDEDRTIRGIGLSAVKDMHATDQASAAPQLAAMLKPAQEPTAANRAAIARLIGGLKAEGAPAAEDLSAAATGDPDPLVRSACLAAIAAVLPAEQAAPLVAKGLSDKEATVRLVAAVRLRQLRPSAAPAVKELAAALADSDSRVRAATAEALILVGKPAVETLADRLTAESVDARKLALACLAKIGPNAKDALPAIEKCLADENADVKKLAAAAVARIKAVP
jgi:HEAT repeat protein